MADAVEMLRDTMHRLLNSPGKMAAGDPYALAAERVLRVLTADGPVVIRAETWGFTAEPVAPLEAEVARVRSLASQILRPDPQTVEVTCSSCGLTVPCPVIGEGRVSIEPLTGWTGPPLRCPGCTAGVPPQRCLSICRNTPDGTVNCYKPPGHGGFHEVQPASLPGGDYFWTGDVCDAAAEPDRVAVRDREPVITTGSGWCQMCTKERSDSVTVDDHPQYVCVSCWNHYGHEPKIEVGS